MAQSGKPTLPESTRRVPQALIRDVETLLDGRAVGGGVLDGGRSRNVYALDVETPAGTLPLVVRQESGAGPQTGTRFTLLRESQLLQAIPSETGIAPKCYGVVADGAAIVMERLPGAATIPADATRRSSVVRGFAAGLARLHALPIRSLRLPFDGSCDSQAGQLADLAEYEEAYRRFCVPHEVIDRGLAWLRSNSPDAYPRAVLLHGDAGPGNFMQENGVLTGLIDWEMSHAGDPHDDLAWIWFRGCLLKHDPRVDDYFEAYAEHASLTIEAQRLRYFIVQILVRCSTMCGVRQHHDPARDDTRGRQIRALLELGLDDAARGRMEKLPALPRIALER